ncbi:MAG: EamA family transporter RarD [Hyphomicrobiales bacterium]
MADVSSELRLRRTQTEGVLFAIAAYGAWGFLVFLYRALRHVDTVELIAHRAVWSLVFLVGVLAFRKSYGRLWSVLKSPKLLACLFFTGSLTAINWGIFVWTVAEDRILESALGYYINPLVSVLLGVVLLGERLSRPQTVAIALAALGVVFFGFSLGVLPWVPLALAFTFGFYGYFRKIIEVGPAVGLIVETFWMSMLALPYILWQVDNGLSQWDATPWSPWLLIATGPATALPLLWFTAAAQRVRLATLGMLQYLLPTIHFLIAVFAFGEAVTFGHIVTFGLIWTALVIFSGEMLLREKRARSGAI